MINSRVKQLNTLHFALRFSLIRQLQKYQPFTDYSDQNCLCSVNTDFKVKGQCVVIGLQCKPKKLIFEGIDFSMKMLLNCIHPQSQIIVYNDRRVFHPNINLMNCQLTSKVIKFDLKSADILNGEMQVFWSLIRHIMEIIVNPDCCFVADNLYNHKAAWHYIYNRANYKNLIFEHCPANLNKVKAGHYHHNPFQEINQRCVMVQRDRNQSIWSIQFTQSNTRISNNFQNFNEESNFFEERKIKLMKDQCFTDSNTEINEINED